MWPQKSFYAWLTLGTSPLFEVNNRITLTGENLMWNRPPTRRGVNAEALLGVCVTLRLVASQWDSLRWLKLNTVVSTVGSQKEGCGFRSSWEPGAFLWGSLHVLCVSARVLSGCSHSRSAFGGQVNWLPETDLRCECASPDGVEWQIDIGYKQPCFQVELLASWTVWCNSVISPV